jgi:hypothetical protein
MRHTRLVALALAATTLLVAGCGGSSKTDATTTAAVTPPTNTTETTSTAASTTTSPATTATVKVASGTPLTRARWISTGDAICAHLFAQIDANPVKSASDFGHVLPQVAIYERTEAAELAKLVPPASKVHDWQQILSNTEREATNTAKLGESAQAGQFNATSPLSKATEKLEIQVSTIAKHNGFTQCSRL